DDEHRDARVPRLDDALVDELDGPDVDAAGGLGREEQTQLAVQLARDDDLLLVAAGERAGRLRGPLRADVELLDALTRESVEHAAADRAGGRERAVAGTVEDEVLGDAEPS